MKGLIVKDLMVAGRQIRTALVIVLFYAVLFWRNAAVLVGLMSLMCMMTVVSSFSYDEASRFLSYAAALPVARRTIVRAKYALGFGLLALGAGGSALLTMLVGVLAGGLASLEALGAAAGCTLAMGFMLCLTLPLMFRFGVEKGRALMIFIVVAGAISALANEDPIARLSASYTVDGEISLGVRDVASVTIAVRDHHFTTIKAPSAHPRVIMEFADLDLAHGLFTGTASTIDEMCRGTIRLAGMISMADNVNRILDRVSLYLG